MAKANFYRELEKFVDELYADGTAGKWKVDKKLKQAKQMQRKAAKKLREQKVINERLGEGYKAKKSA